MASSLSLEEMKQFVRDHFEEFVNRRNADVICENLTADFYDHDGPGGKPTGVEGDLEMMLGMYEKMPDLHVTIEDMIAEGDKVMCRNSWRWTDSGTKKRMQFRGFVLVALRGRQDRRALGNCDACCSFMSSIGFFRGQSGT